MASPKVPLRPRWLYLAFFAWLAGHGRFTALFFEDLGLSDTQIGILLAICPLATSLTAPSLGFWADRVEQQRWRLPGTSIIGHSAALAVFGLVTTLCFMLFLGGTFFSGNANYRFAYFFVVQSFFSVAKAPASGVLDGLTLTFISSMGEDKIMYGAERLYGAVGWALSNLALGLLADLVPGGLLTVIYPFVVVNFVLLLIVLSRFSAGLHSYNSGKLEDDANTMHLNKPRKKVLAPEVADDSLRDNAISGSDESSSWSTFMLLLRRFGGSPSRCGFVLSAIVMTAATAIVEDLLFLFFSQDLNASNLLCGISVVVTVVWEVPIFKYAAPLLKQCGANSLLAVSAIAYVIRVLGYTLVSNQWLVLTLEPLHGVTYACLKTATVQYVALVTPPGMDATAQVLLGSIMSLFGRLVGTGVGGYIQESYGAIYLYRGAALLVLVTLILQFLVVTLDKDAGSTATSSEPHRSDGEQRASHSERIARRSTASTIARRVLSGKSKKHNWAPLSQTTDNEPLSEIEFAQNSGIVFI